MLCILFCAQIIQADLIHGLFGFGDSSGTNPPGESVSAPSPNNTPNGSSLPEPSHPVSNNNDKPNNSDSNDSSTSPKTPSPQVQPSSPTIPPVSNSPPSPLSSSPVPVSSNMDNSAPGADTTPSTQSNNNPSPTTTTPNSSKNEPSDALPKSHSSDGGNSSSSKNNDSKNRNNNDSNSNSDVNATFSSEPDIPADSTPESNHHSSTGTIAGAVLGGIVGLALIGGIVTWCNRKGGCTKRQNGVRDGGLKQTDLYSIDMHPHSSTSASIKNPASTGMMEMTPASPFDHSRRLVAGMGPPSGAVPVYTDSHYHHQQEYEPQQYKHNEEIVGDGTGYYYQQDEAKWNHDQQQQHSNYGDYYQPDTYKPDTVDQYNNKPNAI
ncbi:unnamed protein product [Absidia cylindrospora]